MHPMIFETFMDPTSPIKLIIHDIYSYAYISIYIFFTKIFLLLEKESTNSEIIFKGDPIYQSTFG